MDWAGNRDWPTLISCYRTCKNLSLVLGSSFLFFSIRMPWERRDQFTLRRPAPASSISGPQRRRLPMGFAPADLAPQIHGPRIVGGRQVHGSWSQRGVLCHRICWWRHQSISSILVHLFFRWNDPFWKWFIMSLLKSFLSFNLVISFTDKDVLCFRCGVWPLNKLCLLSLRNILVHLSFDRWVKVTVLVRWESLEISFVCLLSLWSLLLVVLFSSWVSILQDDYFPAALMARWSYASYLWSIEIMWSSLLTKARSAIVCTSIH